MFLVLSNRLAHSSKATACSLVTVGKIFKKFIERHTGLQVVE